MAKKKIELIDVNECPIVRHHKKNFCPWCDKANAECKCKRSK